jgi:hypothetical protein
LDTLEYIIKSALFFKISFCSNKRGLLIRLKTEKFQHGTSF